MIVLASTEEILTEKITLKMVCLRRQVTVDGLPINTRQQRKQIMSDTSRV